MKVVKEEDTYIVKMLKFIYLILLTPPLLPTFEKNEICKTKN